MINSKLRFLIYNKSLIQINFAERHFWKNMECVDLNPPKCVRGMKELKREMFDKKIIVPSLCLPQEKVNKVLPYINKFLLKMEKLRPIRLKDGDFHEKVILLHPLAVNNWESLPSEIKSFGLNEKNFNMQTLNLSYDNWKAEDVLKSILHDCHESFTSFSRIGHIIHINLRDHLQPYKNIIGQILKDKIVGCRTVVNKIQNIANTYRNFELELICGDPIYKVEVKENGVIFEFDFSKVYWNPRLSTEHERIINMLNMGDRLYDVFAGVGPFSIPAASKKKCTVLANDLNPESYKWLNVNAKRNKCEDKMKIFNKDGRDFIEEDIKSDLKKIWTSEDTTAKNIHITMNLPAIALSFLDTFIGLFANETFNPINKIYPIVHVYAFETGDDGKDKLKLNIKKILQTNINNLNLIGIYFVRNVAPNKDMFRISFRLTDDILFYNKNKKTKIK